MGTYAPARSLRRGLHRGEPSQRSRSQTASRIAHGEVSGEFDYTDKKGNLGRRLVEPYSLRRSSAGDLLLYTFDRHRGEVRSFTVSSIRNVRVTQQVFVPQRVIELTSSGPIHAPAVERTPGYRPSESSGGRSYVYACTVCGREFRHSEQNPSLRKHRTDQGWDCSGRRGYFVRWE